MSSKINDLFTQEDEKTREENLSNDKEIFKKIRFGDTEPSPEDERDFVAGIEAEEVVFPDEYLAPETGILNQGSIGSCVAHACATTMAQGEAVKLGAFNEYSRGYIYGNRRDTDTQREGMVVRQALKNLNHCGDVLYDDFPYNKTYPKVKELIEANKEELAAKALPHAIIDYYRCYDADQIKTAVMENGGVIVCVPVYTDFARDLHISKTQKLRGYHAMVIVGWTKEGKWIVQNSWGKLWGYNGCLLMDTDYPVSEYWAITVNAKDANPQPKKSWIKKLIDWLASILTKMFSNWRSSK